MQYQIIPAREDPQRYIDIFNRHIQFAPYTLALTPELMQQHILPFGEPERQLCVIARCERGEGILHVGLMRNDMPHATGDMGMIYLLLGDDNRITEHLLRYAEQWFAEKQVELIRACNYRPNPYKFILHGSETYVWGGFTHTINAFRRLQYDLQDESVIMICRMAQQPVVDVPAMEGLCFVTEPMRDDELVYSAKIRALLQGEEVGHCIYHDLKAISSYFRKPMGQISIGIQHDLYGAGLGRALLLSAHRQLYDRGARQVMLHTVQRLFRAIKLYEKVGYQEQNIRAFCFVKEPQSQ